MQEHAMSAPLAQAVARPPAARYQPGWRRHTEPFRSSEEAWFWTMAALTARREGARVVANRGLVARPCEPDDVVKCLDQLYHRNRIDLAHARVLRHWGERGQAPSAHHPAERAERQLWHEALERLDWLLRLKGIVS
jgi:hypothetical protein